MKVATSQPFEIVYSLFQHEYLGYLLESFVIQMNTKGQLTLQYQNISSKNAQEFSTKLDAFDYTLVELMDSIQPEVIIKKFYNKKISSTDFFLKVYDKEKGDTLLQEAIERYIEDKKSKILHLIKQHEKRLFVMGTDGNPTWKKVTIDEAPATVLFHFRRNEDNTHYFPTIKHKGLKVEFKYKDAIIVCYEPAWLLLEGQLYHFAKKVDGNKLKPFLRKKFIAIPKNVEETYYKKFVAPLIASFDVYAKGFEIKSARFLGDATLHFTEICRKTSATSNTLFEEASEVATLEETEVDILFELYFQYDKYRFKANDQKEASVSVEKQGDSYIFHRISREVEKEKAILALLEERQLSLKHAKALLPKKDALTWIEQNIAWLAEHNIHIKQNRDDTRRYFVGVPTIQVSIRENKDWFDIYTHIQFGEYEIPFVELRKYILNQQTEFQLPNGEIAIIPSNWLTNYSELFHFTQLEEEGLQLHKQHISLVQNLEQEHFAEVNISKKLAKLKDFTNLEDYPMPQQFQGALRPYQKAGYNWMRFLNEYQLGGCLADDMGLGKTIQALALLQSEKENDPLAASLIVVPTSLVYNWELEAKKFTPNLRFFTYTGTHRTKDIHQFAHCDVVLTTYGIVRIDIDLLENYTFNYIILDESQAIKNPSSNIARAVRRLHSNSKLILTGTPLENTTLDLWSQMSFINPNLLGSQSFFKKEYLNPIEKEENTDKLKHLYAVIKPFILRRNKSQVAKELPPKIENIYYCEMTDLQKEYYEQVKSEYRNQILEQIEQQGVAKSQFLLLRGLTQLRQIANHPYLVDTTYDGHSGKLEEILDKLAFLVQKGHKVLIFSQFVKHLSLLREYLDYQELPYAYLDGSTKNRQEQVDKFQQESQIQIFLISLKAGGVGLNLTAAEYVFILDPWWNPAIEAQAIDRAHRIGQKQTVITYKFIVKDSVEEKILALQGAKQRLAQELITAEEGFMKNLTQEDILLLLS
ncbi:MAG: DEAD/DEAH box helicase [Thermonemataceae bacterium]